MIQSRKTAVFFERMSKRRRGFPSETHVKRGVRIVHGDKMLEEKLGATISARAEAANDSRRAASSRAAFDGSLREDYF